MRHTIFKKMAGPERARRDLSIGAIKIFGNIWPHLLMWLRLDYVIFPISGGNIWPPKNLNRWTGHFHDFLFQTAEPPHFCEADDVFADWYVRSVMLFYSIVIKPSKPGIHAIRTNTVAVTRRHHGVQKTCQCHKRMRLRTNPTKIFESTN